MHHSSYKELSDEALVDLVRDKDQELYSLVVERYQDKLLRYISYLIQDADLAQDVAQNAFLKAFINLRGFDTKRAFKSWIYRIAHNEAINASKKKYRRRLVEQGLELLERLPSKQHVEDEYQKALTKKQVEDLVDALPLKYRSVVALHYLDELSYKEISAILQIPIGTVGTRINRGKKKLYSIYQLHHGEDHETKKS